MCERINKIVAKAFGIEYRKVIWGRVIGRSIPARIIPLNYPTALRLEIHRTIAAFTLGLIQRLIRTFEALIQIFFLGE